MPANEFEKQVQGRMNELGLVPSESVWLEVERRIRPEKKRRIIFWIPLLVLGLGMAIGTIMLTKKPQPKKISHTALNLPVTKNTGSAPVIVPAETVTGKAEDQPVSNKRSTQDITITNNYPGPKKVFKNPAGPVIVKQSFQETVMTIPEKEPVIVTKDPSGQQTNPDLSITKVEKNKEKPVTTVDSPAITKSIVDPVVIPVENNEQEKAPALKKINQRKWKWGIMVQLGSSGIVESAHFFNRQSDAAYFSNPTSSTGGPSFSPGVTRPTTSFGGGIFMQRAISRSSLIRFNFQYSMLATKMYTGSRVDSARIINNSSSQGIYVSNFYRPAASTNMQTYKNRYHMLGLSADFSWNITKSKKFSISWENSLGYYIMVSSNALYFDWNIPGYYKDFKLAQKQQVFLSTGLSAPLSANFIVNIFAEYGLGTVLNKPVPAPTHFTNFGIRARLFPFQKK